MMITVTQTRREITVRSARLDYVEIDKRVATMPALDTTMPAVPTDTKAPSTKLFAAQLAALSAGQFTDEATEGPFARKVWQMYVYNGIPMLREVVALALLLTLSALAGDRESIVVDSVSRETAQEVHFTGTVLVPTPTATSQVANAIYVQQQAAAAESAAKAAVSAHDGAADPHHGKFDLAGTATAAAAAAESAAKAASDPAGTSAAVESALKSRLSSIDIRLFQEIFLTATHIAAGTEYGPAGFFDCFTTDSVATKTNAYYDSSLKLYDSLTPGTFDLCIGGTANSSSGVAEANKAFDDNISTSCGFPEWITYTFSTGVTAYSYSVNNNNTRPIKTLTLSGSNNGSTWTTLHTITNQSLVDTNMFYITSPGSYQYYKWEFVPTWNPVMIVELALYAQVSPQNITLISTAPVTLSETKTSAAYFVLLNCIDSVVLGEDIKLYGSMDGTTFAEGTITDIGLIYGGIYRLYRSEISGMAPGTSPKIKLQSFGVTPKRIQVKAWQTMVTP